MGIFGLVASGRWDHGYELATDWRFLKGIRLVKLTNVLGFISKLEGIECQPTSFRK
jgi:hypothetical protein